MPTEAEKIITNVAPYHKLFERNEKKHKNRTHLTSNAYRGEPSIEVITSSSNYTFFIPVR